MNAPRTVAIVDYGMGNLFSVKHACTAVDLPCVITAEREALLAADAVILPGVGAFGDAMAALRRLDLVGVLRDIVQSERPFLGICLGMQLLMTRSEEFGRFEGLDIIPGQVRRFDQPRTAEGRRLKVPEVQWNRLLPVDEVSWDDTLLAQVPRGEFMYFVHSYYCMPDDNACGVSQSQYGQYTFCSSLQRGNVFACQYHPERSGPAGLQLYRNFARQVVTA